MRTLILFLAVAGAAFGQLDSDTVTVTATRTTPAQYDSATLQVQISLPQTAVLEDALAVVKGAGFAATDLVSVSGTVSNPFPVSTTPVYWSFSRTVSSSELPAALSTLEQLRRTMQQNLYYSVGNAASPAPSCVYPALISDAQKQAQSLTDAAGLKLGSIVSISQGVQQAVVPTFANQRSGDFSFSTTSFTVPILLSPRPSFSLTTPCSLTVQFRILR